MRCDNSSPAPEHLVFRESHEKACDYIPKLSYRLHTGNKMKRLAQQRRVCFGCNEVKSRDDLGFFSKNPDCHTHPFSLITPGAISAAHIHMGEGQSTGTRSIYHTPKETASPPGSRQLSIAPELRGWGG